MDWIFVQDALPPIETSTYRTKPLMLCTWEFGFGKGLCVGYMFQSSALGQEPQWYLDESFYHLDRPWLIAPDVIAWANIVLPEFEVTW
jgi:hypothetical protein